MNKENNDSLVGRFVFHKKFGKGTVLKCGDGVILVEFEDRQVKLAYPKVVQDGMMTDPDCDIEDVEEVVVEKDSPTSEQEIFVTKVMKRHTKSNLRFMKKNYSMPIFCSDDGCLMKDREPDFVFNLSDGVKFTMPVRQCPACGDLFLAKDVLDAVIIKAMSCDTKIVGIWYRGNSENCPDIIKRFFKDGDAPGIVRFEKKENKTNAEHAHANYQSENAMHVPTKSQPVQSVVISLRDVVILRNVRKCQKRNHTLVDVNAQIEILHAQTAETSKKSITMGFCPVCNRYYMLKSDYEQLKDYGVIMCCMKSDTEFKTNSVYGLRQQQSILMNYGYSVSATRGLSAVTRQRILAMLIDEKIVTKMQIKSHIDDSIRLRRRQPNMKSAIEKWKDDLDFVNDYKRGQYTNVRIRI